MPKISLQREENFSNVFPLFLLEKGSFATFLRERAFFIRFQDFFFNDASFI